MVPLQETHASGIYLPFHGGICRREDKRPQKRTPVNLQKVYPSVKEEVDKMEGLIKWNWRALQAGSPLFDIAKEALEFGRRALLVKSLLEMIIGSL
jgi:hypothetical protein